MTKGLNWREATAPTLADFELLAAQAWERLPADFPQNTTTKGQYQSHLLFVGYRRITTRAESYLDNG